MNDPTCRQALDLKVGDWVVVRSAEEILQTLDENACLEELPFMPQMLQHCGMKFRVRKRAHKMCDTVYGTGARQMSDAVFLEDICCDGQAFGGCEMGCSIVWKEAWLRRAGENEPAARSIPSLGLEDLVWKASRPFPSDAKSGEPIYVCQATKVPAATRPLPLWSLHQYVVDYKSGNVALPIILSRLMFVLYSQLVSSGAGFGSLLRRTYNIFQAARGGMPFPVHIGRIRAGEPTPKEELGLKVGDVVRVKSIDQILATVDERLINRGLGFHTEMAPYCGKTFRVKQRVRKIINEKTGQLMTLKNSCLVLDGVDCNGRFTRPINCPRALPPYWREIWLEHVETAAELSSGDEAKKRVTC